MPSLRRPIRCFVGLPLPPEYQQALARVQRGLAGVLASRLAWTRPGNWHLTLKFLGDVEAGRLAALTAALGSVAFAAFDLCAGRAGTFPPLGRGQPRVLWVGLSQGAEACGLLAADIERALAPLGFAPEARGFAAHLTLGRVKEAARGDDWGAVERAVANEAWPVAGVSRFVLWQSVLQASGPEYAVLGEFPARAG